MRELELYEDLDERFSQDHTPRPEERSSAGKPDAIAPSNRSVDGPVRLNLDIQSYTRCL
jgi:hypothetical protein